MKEHSHGFYTVEASFLEFSQPQIESVVEKMVADGVTSIYIYPYFLNTGKHVYRDIPNLVTRLKEHYLEVSFEILPHFGSGTHILSGVMQDLKGL